MLWATGVGAERACCGSGFDDYRGYGRNADSTEAE
jgi:hypothetical protein